LQPTTKESSYYVSISRARGEAAIYTDDKAMLPASLSREDQISDALDVKLEPSPIGHVVSVADYSR
jgi:hypothetical protein